MNQGYSSKRLTIRRPPIIVSFIQAGGGGLMVLLVIAAGLFNGKFVDDLVQFIRGEGLRANRELEFLFVGIFSIIVFPYLIILLVELIRGLVQGLKNLISGLGEVVTPYMPANIPAAFRDYQQLFNDLRARRVGIYTPLEPFLSGLFSKNTMFLSPVERMTFIRNGGSLKGHIGGVIGSILVLAGFWFLFYLIGNFVGENPISSTVAGFFLSRQNQVMIYLPFILLIIANISFAGLEFIANFLMVPRRQANTVALESTEHYRGFGHPTNLFTRLPILSEPLAWQGFINRYFTDWNEAASNSVGDVGAFNGRILIENQPRPLATPAGFSAYLQLLTGWVFSLSGMVVYFFFLLPAPLRRMDMQGNFAYAPVVFLVLWILAAQLVSNGNRYIQQAREQLESTKFQSDAIMVEVSGNMSRADIKVGKGVTDSIESSNVTTRSDFTTRFWAAELISEAARLDTPRELLAFNQVDSSYIWTDFFRKSINTLREERVKPVGIDLEAQELNEIVKANVGAAALRSAMLKNPPIELPRKEDLPFLQDAVAPKPNLRQDSTPTQLEKQPPVEEDVEEMDTLLTPPPAPMSGDPDYKECPDCGEMVRSKARKCRFCGYRFEGVD